MAQGKITFSGGGSPSAEELAGGVPAQINALTDAAGAIRMRPGISTWEDFPLVIPNASPVRQIGLWDGKIIYVTDDRKLWALIAPGSVVALSDGTAATQLDGGLRPIIAADRVRVVIAGGGKPQKWNGLGLSARLGGSPPNFSHVTASTLRLVGNDSGVSGLIYWSGLGDTGHETWQTGLDFTEAEAEPDACIGVYESSGEVVALGSRTVQMFSPDPSVTFSSARAMKVGCLAAHSFVGIDEQFLFLDTQRRIEQSNGRSMTSVSSPAMSEVLDRKTLTDSAAAACWGMRGRTANWDAAIFRFPTVGSTYAYDVPTKAWSDWRSWTGAWADFLPTSSVYWPERNTTLVGLADGRIAKLDMDVASDMGSPVICEVTSPFTDHGIGEPKHCQRVNFRFRRGPTLAGGTIAISYRDDLGPFGQPFLYTLDASSDPNIEINSLGVYKTRQWKVQVSGARLAFAGAQETFTMTRV